MASAGWTTAHALWTGRRPRLCSRRSAVATSSSGRACPSFPPETRRAGSIDPALAISPSPSRRPLQLLALDRASPPRGPGLLRRLAAAYLDRLRFVGQAVDGRGGVRGH